MTPNDLKLKKLQKYGFMHIKRKLVTQAMLKQIWYTLLTSWLPLMTSNDLKIEIWKLQLYVYQMKASKPGNLKTDIEYIFDPLVTFFDP